MSGPYGLHTCCQHVLPNLQKVYLIAQGAQHIFINGNADTNIYCKAKLMNDFPTCKVHGVLTPDMWA